MTHSFTNSNFIMCLRACRDFKPISVHPQAGHCINIEPNQSSWFDTKQTQAKFGEAIFLILPCSYFPTSKPDTLMLTLRSFTLSSQHPLFSNQTETHTRSLTCFEIGVRWATNSLALQSLFWEFRVGVRAPACVIAC